MAVSATVTPGAVVTSTDQITVSLLNQLANPTVDIAGSVGSLSIGSGSIYNNNISASAAMAYSKMEATLSGKMIVGNGSNVSAIATLSGDASLAFNSSTGNADLTIGANRITTAKILDANVTTAKIADDAVTTSKLADTAVTAAKLATTAVSAGSYAAADITVDANGRLTAASSSTPVTGIKSAAFTASGTWTAPSGITRATFTIIGGGGGGSQQGYSGGAGGYCRITASVTAATGYAVVVGGNGLGGNPLYSGTPTAGGDSTVVVGATTYTGGGGAVGSSSDNGSGGSATNGDINLTGDSGVKHYDHKWGGRGWIGSYGEGGPGGDGNSGEPGSGRKGYGGIVIVEWLD